MAGMRRSEVSALLWGDVAEATAGDGMLMTVRCGKTNPEGEARDVRFVKGDVAGAVRALRAAAAPGGAEGRRGAALAADGGAAVSGGGAGGRRRGGDRPLGPGGAGRGDGRARGGGAAPLKPGVAARGLPPAPSASTGLDLGR